jgi:nucleotide-binding universal stress UspA family protein
MAGRPHPRGWKGKVIEMFRKILIANDGSEGARKALQTAIELTARYGAKLHSISVEEDLPRYVATVGEFEEVKRQKDAYFEQLNNEAMVQAQASGVMLTPHVVAGHEVESIVNFCKEGGFDLLIVGFMGHSRIFERIWGSTSQTLTRIAPCSVLVVK